MQNTGELYPEFLQFIDAPASMRYAKRNLEYIGWKLEDCQNGWIVRLLFIYYFIRFLL